MLSREQIGKIAADHLIKKGYPIVVETVKVIMPEEQNNEEYRTYFLENNLAFVSFISKYIDDPDHDLDPGVYMVFVNIINGESRMAPIM